VRANQPGVVLIWVARFGGFAQSGLKV
jgi:hypothetical protein